MTTLTTKQAIEASRAIDILYEHQNVPALTLLILANYQTKLAPVIEKAMQLRQKDIEELGVLRPDGKLELSQEAELELNRRWFTHTSVENEIDIEKLPLRSYFNNALLLNGVLARGIIALIDFENQLVMGEINNESYN